jgi:transposase
MQVVFSVEEFRFLVHTLREFSESHPELSAQSKASALLDKVLAHDFAFSIDELEDLEQILKAYESKAYPELVDSQSWEKRRNAQLLERVLDRVTEACAMG